MSRLCGWGFLAATLLGLLLVASLLLGGSAFGELTTPALASVEAAATDTQLLLLVGVTGLLLVVALAAFVWCVTSSSQQSHEAADARTGSDPNSSLLWWLPMLLGMALLAVAECSGWFCSVSPVEPVVQTANTEAKAIWARVRLRTYECRVTYAGRDKRWGTLDDLHVAGELRVPLDETVIVQVEADDGPHRWYLPAMRRSVEVRKGQPVAVKIWTKAAGNFDMVSVDLSGGREDSIAGRLVVETASELRDWLNQRTQQQQTQQTAAVEVQP